MRFTRSDYDDNSELNQTRKKLQTLLADNFWENYWRFFEKTTIFCRSWPSVSTAVHYNWQWIIFCSYLFVRIPYVKEIAISVINIPYFLENWILLAKQLCDCTDIISPKALLADANKLFPCLNLIKLMINALKISYYFVFFVSWVGNMQKRC